jgi:hypothetical protein
MRYTTAVLPGCMGNRGFQEKRTMAASQGRWYLRSVKRGNADIAATVGCDVRARAFAGWGGQGEGGDACYGGQHLAAEAQGHYSLYVGGRWRSALVGLRAEMGPLRKSMSVRLEEGVHARLRRQSLRSGVPTSALVRALVHRWLDEQDEAGEANTGPLGSERERQPGLFGEEGGL